MLTNINVTNLVPAQGTTISSSSSIGSISYAGDINGDGYKDFFINIGGTTYLFWGGKNLGNINLDNFSSSYGITITFTYLSECIGVGDVNGDGIDDILCNAPTAGDLYEGISYLIPGGSNLVDIDLNNCNICITITGAAYFDGSGYWISSAGDVNGDGFFDFFIGFSTSQTVYLLLGHSDWTNMNLGSLTTSQGVQITASSDITNCAGTGDVNGDNIDDVMCNTYYKNTPNTGKSSFIFGHTTWSNMDLAICDPSLCTTVQDTNNYDRDNWVISGAGDVRGSGFSDFLVTVNSSLTYRINGKSSGWNDMNLVKFNFTQGNIITSPKYYGFSGGPLAPLGDINQDGYDDFAMGAALSDLAASGILYVFLGAQAMYDINLINFGYSNGITIQGIYDTISLAGLGDVNGDGYPDIGITDTHDAWIIWGGEFNPLTPTNKPTSRPNHPTKPTTPTTMSPTPEGYTYPPTIADDSSGSSSDSWIMPVVASVGGFAGAVLIGVLGYYGWKYCHPKSDNSFELINSEN